MNSITIVDLCAKTVLDKRGSDVAQIWDLSAPRAKAHHAVRPKWAISVPTAWRTQRLDNRQTVFALALDLVLHDHFKYQLVMHWSILMKTSCSNISILNAASKQSRIKLHQNGCFHLVLPIYCITCFDCVGFTPQRGSLGSSLDGPVRPPINNIKKFYTEENWGTQCILIHIGANKVSADLNILLSVQKFDQ